MSYLIVDRVPSAETYCEIRVQCGLSGRSVQAAQKALPKSVYGVSVMHQDKVVGMGRIIGDDCFWYVVDICVLPEHQKQGLGKRIMTKLKEYIDVNASVDCDVVLLAVDKAKFLYEQFGFESTVPMGTVSMRLNKTKK